MPHFPVSCLTSNSIFMWAPGRAPLGRFLRRVGRTWALGSQFHSATPRPQLLLQPAHLHLGLFWGRAGVPGPIPALPSFSCVSPGGLCFPQSGLPEASLVPATWQGTDTAPVYSPFSPTTLPQPQHPQGREKRSRWGLNLFSTP